MLLETFVVQLQLIHGIKGVLITEIIFTLYSEDNAWFGFKCQLVCPDK